MYYNIMIVSFPRQNTQQPRYNTTAGILSKKHIS